MNTAGKATESTVILTLEAHKSHKSFRVNTGNPVRKSQPVKLNSNGTISPAASGDNANLIIGISTQEAKPGERATIALKGYALILCRAAGAVAPGPVEYDGFYSVNPAGDETTALPAVDNVFGEKFYGVNEVKTALATSANIFGWAIEVAADGTNVEVIVKA